MTLSQPADFPTTDSALSGGPLVNVAIADAFTLDELPGSSTTNVVPILDTWIQETPMTPVKCVPSNVISGTVTTLDLDNGPSTSTEHFTPMVIRPLPKVGPNKTNRRRKTQKAEIVTSTPIKDEQRNKISKKLNLRKEKCTGTTKNLKRVLRNKKQTSKNQTV